MQIKAFVVIAAAWAMSCAFAETVNKVKTERGDSVEVIEDMPPGSGPFPAVVVKRNVSNRAARWIDPCRRQ